MAILHAENIDDIVSGTLRDLGRDDLRQIAQSLQRYEVMPRWFRQDKIVISSGYGIQRSLLDVLNANSAKHVGLMEEDTINQVDHLTNLQVDWVHATNNWSYDIREMAMNSGVARVQNVVRARELASQLQMALELEKSGWTIPSATNRKTAYGIPYWVVWNATDGFTGGNPAGHTTVAGIDVSVHTNFKNWAATYIAATFDDLIKKMKRMHRKIGFVSPVDADQLAGPRGDQYRYYCNDTTYGEFEEAQRMQNDRLGPDVGQLNGMVVFKMSPVIWVAFLDDNMAAGSDPVYAINHGAFYPGVLEGQFFVRTGPMISAKQHMQREVHRDVTYQFVCVDRRSCGVIAKSDPAP